MNFLKRFGFLYTVLYNEEYEKRRYNILQCLALHAFDFPNKTHINSSKCLLSLEELIYVQPGSFQKCLFWMN
jgi:hypothetical protein